MNKECQEIGRLIKICHENIKTSKRCLKYLKDRNISISSIKKYKLGYFPQNTATLVKYVSKDILQKNRIINLSGYSDFSNRYFLVFPIFNEYKDPVAILGRTFLTETQRSLLNLPKYKNSSYKKSRILYGLEHARPDILKKKNVFVVEGNFDVITMDSNNIHNVVGICGAAFSRHHFYKLTRYTDKITFLLDNDSGGQMAMKRIYSKFANRGVKIRFSHLPSEVKDVDEYFTKYDGTKESFFQDLKNFIPSW